MGRQATVYAMVACNLLMYSLIGWSPTSSIDATTGGNYHSLSSPCVAIIPVILLDARLRNPSRIFSIPPVTTLLSLPYNITNCSTALYIILRAHNVPPVFSSWNIVDKNVDVDFHREYEDGVVEGKGIYNQIYSSKKC